VRHVSGRPGSHTRIGGGHGVEDDEGDASEATAAHRAPPGPVEVCGAASRAAGSRDQAVARRDAPAAALRDGRIEGRAAATDWGTAAPRDERTPHRPTPRRRDAESNCPSIQKFQGGGCGSTLAIWLWNGGLADED